MLPSVLFSWASLQPKRSSCQTAAVSPWANTQPLLHRSEAFAEDLADLLPPVPQALARSNLAHRGWVQRAVLSVTQARGAANPTQGPRDLLVLAAALAVLHVTEIEFQVG